MRLRRDAAGKVVGADRSAGQIPDIANGAQAFAWDAANQAGQYSYDERGRVVSDGLRRYVWDSASRLASYSGADGSAAFTYDGLGRRVSRTSAGTTEAYVLNYAHRAPRVAVGRRDGADAVYYIWSPDGRLLASIDAAGARRFYHFDENGSTILLTANDGAVLEQYAPTPFGESSVSSVPAPAAARAANGSHENAYRHRGEFGVHSSGGLLFDEDDGVFVDPVTGIRLTLPRLAPRDPANWQPEHLRYRIMPAPPRRGPFDPPFFEPTELANPLLVLRQDYPSNPLPDPPCDSAPCPRPCPSPPPCDFLDPVAEEEQDPCSDPTRPCPDSVERPACDDPPRCIPLEDEECPRSDFPDCPGAPEDPDRLRYRIMPALPESPFGPVPDGWPLPVSLNSMLIPRYIDTGQPMRETLRLADMVRKQAPGMLRQIVDRYNETARNIIQSMGR